MKGKVHKVRNDTEQGTFESEYRMFELECKYTQDGD